MKCAAAFVLAAVVALDGPIVAQTPGRAVVVLENDRVRAYRSEAGVLAGVQHGPGVVVWLSDSGSMKSGRAIWLDDVALPPGEGSGSGPIAIVQLREHPAA